MKVLIADKFAQDGADQLREAGCELLVDPSLEGDALREAISQNGCNVLIVRSTKVTEPMLAAGRELKLVIRAGSGYDTIDVKAATGRNIRVCNCPGMNAVAVAELAIGLMIALDRRIVDQTVDLRNGVWKKKEYSKARGLKTRTLGIVGLGRIGYEIAKRAAAFEMNLIYADVVEMADAEGELGIRKVPLEQLLVESDFVTLHVPGGKATGHLIGAKELSSMKPTAFLLNCSRGGVVDQKALAAAVESGSIAGAALDVYEIEPPATGTKFSDPIVKTPHIYGTHHIGASTEQAQAAVAEETVKIVRTYLDSREFLHCVNPAVP